MKKYYTIFNFISLIWENPLYSIVPDYALKYHYFETERCSDAAKFQITVTSEPPPLEFRRTICKAAERFGIGDDIFEVKHQHGRMRWTSWVSGLNSDHVHIWYDFPVLQRLQYPWPFFPDHLICFHVIEPVIEYKLQQLNVIVLHAGAVAKDGSAILLSGRGGVKKTTYIMNLLKSGWQYLADDLVLMKDGILYPYPMTDTFFDYFYLHESDEKIDLKAMIGALLHVRQGKQISFPVAPPSPVQKVVLLLASNAKAEIRENGYVDSGVIRKICAVDKLERLNFVDEEEAMGRFLLHFNQVLGNDQWNEFWTTHETLLLHSLKDKPFRLICGMNADPDLLMNWE